MLDQEIDYFHSPQIFLKIQLAFGFEQLGQQWRAIDCFRRDRLQKFRSRLRDAAVAKQNLAQRFFSGCSFDGLLTFGADLSDDFVNKWGIVGRPNRH